MVNGNHKLHSVNTMTDSNYLFKIMCRSKSLQYMTSTCFSYVYKCGQFRHYYFPKNGQNPSKKMPDCSGYRYKNRRQSSQRLFTEPLILTLKPLSCEYRHWTHYVDGLKQRNPATTPILVTGQNWHCSEIGTVRVVGFQVCGLVLPSNI